MNIAHVYQLLFLKGWWITYFKASQHELAQIPTTKGSFSISKKGQSNQVLFGQWDSMTILETQKTRPYRRILSCFHGWSFPLPKDHHFCWWYIKKKSFDQSQVGYFPIQLFFCSQLRTPQPGVSSHALYIPYAWSWVRVRFSPSQKGHVFAELPGTLKHLKQSWETQTNPCDWYFWQGGYIKIRG